MSATLLLVDRLGGFIEGPRGYFSLPPDVTETPKGSGLYAIPEYLEEGPYDGLYVTPEPDRRDYFFGGRSNLMGYTLQEDAVSRDPGGLEGGVGQLSIRFNAAVDTLRLSKEVLRFEDTHRNRGMTEGVVRGLRVSDGVVDMTMDSVMTLFNADHVVPPQRGGFRQVLSRYCALVGVTAPLYVTDASLASRSVVYPGWSGNVWDHIKQILSREQAEMSLVGGSLVVRPQRTNVARVDNHETEGIEVNDQNTARAVEVAYFGNRWENWAEVYPVPGEEPAVYTVDAGDTLVTEISLSASLTRVFQPECIDFVEDRSYPNTQGVYAVSGNDGKPIPPAQWLAQGGYVRVELTDDPSVIRVTIRGASFDDYAPYRIAMTSGASNYYNALHITGEGVIQDRKSVHIRTGATSAVTGEEVGVVVENPFIASRGEAYSLGVHTAAARAGVQSIDGTATGVQSRGDDQAFGNTAGSRVRRDNAVYRIRTATLDESMVAYTADIDTLVSDFNETTHDGMTVAEFNAAWSGTLIKDFNTEPLRED